MTTTRDTHGRTEASDATPPDLARVLRDTVAVVDAPDGGRGAVAVWHIDVGPDIGLARPCGAWLLDAGADGERIRSLVAGRRVLATPSGEETLTGAGSETGRTGGADAIDGFVDADATVRAVRDEIDALQEAFDAELRASGRKLVAPEWPSVPDPVRPDGLRHADGDDRTGVALGLGRWLADFADTWQKVERQRLARKFLREHRGDTHRSLPVVTRDGA